jgi:hypothetical protein
VAAEHSEPFTVMESTLFPLMPLPPVVTVSSVEFERFPVAAVMVVVPTAIATALPFEPAAFPIVATDGVDELHVTDAVRSCVEESEYVPKAINCSLAPMERLEFFGVTEMDTRVPGPALDPPPPPLQPGITAMNRNRDNSLFNVIDADSGRD